MLILLEYVIEFAYCIRVEGKPENSDETHLLVLVTNNNLAF